MPQFAFIAKDRMGNTVQGQVEADGEAFAANQIGQMGYTILQLRPIAPAEITQTMAPTPLSQTQAMYSAASPSQTQAMPAGFPPANAPGSAVSPNAAPGTSATAPSPAPTAKADPLADAEKRRKVESDLKRLGMRPEEIRRLLEANPNSTEASIVPSNGTASMPSRSALSVDLPPSSLPAAKPAPNSRAKAQQKLSAAAADLHSFAASLSATAAANRIQAVEEAVLDLPEFRASTAQERHQAEALLREAHALRRRERYADGIAKCREALALVPSDAAALEMYGDMLQGVARTSEALAAYRRAVEADAKRISAERKYGDLLMRQQKWSDGDPEEIPKNPYFATFLSVLLPGAGQIHNGERVKGGVLLACVLVCVSYWLLFTPITSSGNPGTKKGGAPAAAAPVSKKHRDKTNDVPILISIAFYLSLVGYGAVDANVGARRTHRD